MRLLVSSPESIEGERKSRLQLVSAFLSHHSHLIMLKEMHSPLKVLNGQLVHTSGKKTSMFSRAVTLHGLIDLFGVCCLGMLPGFVYNAACSTSQIGDCVAVVRDYRSGR